MDSSEFDAVFKNETSQKQILHIGKYFSIERVKIQHRWEIRKSINENEKTNPVCKESLKREFEIGSQLQHPNICSYYQLSKDESFLNREYIDGLSWSEFFETYPNEKTKIEKYIIQLLDAIHYMHSKGIFHMDLKSENILISHELKTLKIIDFGHALYHNDTLWRGGNKSNLKSEKLISAEQDWNSFFSLLKEIENKILSKSARKIKNAQRVFVRSKHKLHFQRTKAIFENRKKIGLATKLSISLGFVLVILFSLNFNNNDLNDFDEKKEPKNFKDFNSIIKPKKQSFLQKDPSKKIEKLHVVPMKSIHRSFPLKDSLFLVNCASQFGPEFEKELKTKANLIGKYKVFDDLLDEYALKFENYSITQQQDSSKRIIAKRIYDHQLSISINKYVHLLK